MLTGSKARFGTGGSLCRVGNYIVTECVNNGLCYENLVTNTTMLTLGKTCILAIGSNCRVDYLGVSQCRNRFLCYEHLLTYGAMLTLGKTCALTVGSNCRVDYLGMTKSGNSLLLLQDRVAIITFNSVGLACLLAGCRRAGDSLLIVPRGEYDFTLLLTAGAGTDSFTILGAGGVFYGGPFAEFVSVNKITARKNCDQSHNTQT